MREEICVRGFMALSLLGVLGCGASSPNSSGTLNKSALANTRQGLDVESATLGQCPAGGFVYLIYEDLNDNGLRDKGEPILDSQVVCNGGSGEDGRDGVDGEDGRGVVFQLFAAAEQACPGGGLTILIARDANGNSTLDAEDEGLQSASVCNGQSVELPRYAPVALIRPCGDSVAFKEVLLRLNDGQVLAVFSANSAGDMTRLSLLPDGSYVNTDGSSCQFTLATSADGAERAISWWGQVQETWSMR